MRFVSALLALLLLVLSVVPCCDARPAARAETAVVAAAAPNGHSDAAHAECCSPLCQCSCCGSAVCSPQVLQFSAPFRSHAVLGHAARYCASFEDVALPIWQPPQLG